MNISTCQAFKQKLLPATIALLLQSGNHAQANPIGPELASGQAQFAQQGNTLTVNNSNGAVINWQGFSIAPEETTRFIQPSADSRVLNKVTGADPSQLLGTLQSNGKVFLINPAGVLVGEGAKIDVAGFVDCSRCN
jgi:filamentous hemagglutinin family protein